MANVLPRTAKLMSRIILAWMLVGCASSDQHSNSGPSLTVSPELLSGQAVFGELVSMYEVPAHDVLATTTEMQTFVGGIGQSRQTVVRFRRLLGRLRSSGFFDNIYDASVTQTAAETFESRIGNCISYTNLFVALARSVNLKVSYQIVEVEHPTWDVDTGLLIRNNHINVLVQGARFDRNRSSGYTLDFNLVDPEPDSQVTKISDAYALSLYYANLSVNEILQGNNRAAFAYLLRAVDAEPLNSDVWINLGAFYGRHEQHVQALAAYRLAEQLSPREKIILSGLERSYRALGDIERADTLAGQVRRHRQQNPFYHFAVAQTGFEEENYELALTAIEKAIRLKRRNPRFYYLKSLTEDKLANPKAARASLSKAKRYGRFDDLQRRYGGTAIVLN